MSKIDSLNISFTFNLLFLVLNFIFIIIYTILIYQNTIPPISKSFKVFLIFIRTLSLILIVFLIFEPILTIRHKLQVEPITLICVDNSKSIVVSDSSTRSEKIIKTIKDLSNSIDGGKEILTFGSKVREISRDSLALLNFAENLTNYSMLFNRIKGLNKNIASIVILSDGIINDGINPIYTAEKLGIPFYTIGIGDTIITDDIGVKNVLFNEYIYAEKPTVIKAIIINKGFASRSVISALYEDSKLIEQKSIELSKTGINNVEFNYTPKESGEKKMNVVVSQLKGETNFTNNRQIFFVKVLNNKLKVLMLIGSPSSDASFIKNSLIKDHNLQVKAITQISGNSFLEKNNRTELIDSADILFLVGFPSKMTPQDLFDRTIRAIREKNKPFFISLSPGIDYNRLKLMERDLPFTLTQISQGFLPVQPEITDISNALLNNNSSDPVNDWNNLPPAYKSNIDFIPKPESRVLAKTKIRNIPVNAPLILTRKFGNQLSLAVLAKDIWKWKLQTAEKKLDLFDHFILNSVKWLNTKSDQRQINIKTRKRLYSLGEPVEFTAQIYDNTYNPVDNAEVKIKIYQPDEEYEVNMTSIGGGIYEGTSEVNKPGDYQFEGNVRIGSSSLGKTSGKFSIGDIELEKIETSLNRSFLTYLSNTTLGDYYSIEDYENLKIRLKSDNLRNIREKITTSEINLWAYEWFLLVIIILFSLEWFFRKRTGML